MERKVIVSLKSKQIIDGQEESVEMITPGKLYSKEDAYYVVYEETEVSGMEGTTTTLKIGNQNVSLIRFGTVSSKLNFKRGVKDVSLYKTPYGILEVVVNPKEVDIDVNEEGGQIRLVYDLEPAGLKSSKNELLISIH